jgi:hypothetical protein
MFLSEDAKYNDISLIYVPICYVVLFPFAPISMPCRYSLNKKERKKGKKAKPVRYCIIIDYDKMTSIS